MIKDEFKQPISHDSLEGAVVRAMAGPIMTRIPRGVEELRVHLKKRVESLIERYPENRWFLENIVLEELLK